MDPITSKDDPRLDSMAMALHSVCLELAQLVVKDGEGAQKFVTIQVESAVSQMSAKIIACEIANSPLIKTAMAAGDANWGRIVMAVGKSLEPISPEGSLSGSTMSRSQRMARACRTIAKRRRAPSLRSPNSRSA
jgi:N-acetylglutamate synthase/N-acetylornithine aminotransferase